MCVAEVCPDPSHGVDDAMAEDLQPQSVPDEQSYIELLVKYEQSPPSQYANQLLVQVDHHCMFMGFYQMRPPIVLPGDSIRPTHVVAQPVASLAILLENVPAFIQVMQKQLDLLKEKPNATP